MGSPAITVGADQCVRPGIAGRTYQLSEATNVRHRGRAYQESGADVLYAPGVREQSDIATIVAAIDRPLNVVVGAPGFGWSVDELSALGVKRISTGAALARAALTAFLAAARGMHDNGTFAFEGLASGREINAMFPR